MAEALQDETTRADRTWRGRALSVRAAMGRRRALVVTALAILVLGGAGLGFYRYYYRQGTLTVVNLRPCKAAFAVHRPVTSAESVTEGWWILGAGEKLTLKREFYGVGPKFAVYAESRCPEQTRWIYNLPADHPGVVYFEGGPGDTVSYQYIRPESAVRDEPRPTHPVSESQPDPAEEGHRSAWVEVSSRGGAGAESEDGAELAGFVEVPVGGSSKFMHVIVEDQYAGLYDERGLSDADDEKKMEILSGRAALLETSLERQRRFDENWPEPAKSFPYYLGLNLKDHNGLDVPGVLVEEVAYEKSINGDDVPFQAGDIINEFDGQTVFSGLDLNMLLYEHATSLEKGIEVPAEVKLVRGEQVLVVKALYFFNQNYWGQQSKLAAAGVGALNTVAFGGGAAAEALGWKAARGLKSAFKWLAGDKTKEPDPPSYKEERWNIAQRNARLKQFESDAYDVGSVAGLFLPSGPRLIFEKVLARSLARRGLPRLAAVLVASTTLEVAEGVMWTVGDASPLRTPEQIADDVRKITPYAAGVGVVTGMLKRGASLR